MSNDRSTRLDSLVQTLVIRDDCPCGDCAAESWIKLRAVAVAIAPALVAIALLAALEAPESIRWLVPLGLVFVGSKIVTRPINRHNERHGCVADTGVETDR